MEQLESVRSGLPMDSLAVSGSRWHVNPDTFEPAVCRSRVGKCPFGGLPHFSENQLGQHFRIYESVMADHVLPVPAKWHGDGVRVLATPQQLPADVVALRRLVYRRNY
jgi:hypothetical protein